MVKADASNVNQYDAARLFLYFNISIQSEHSKKSSYV